MTEYTTIKSDEYKYGNNFIEVARKKVKDSEAEFISVSKGFYNRGGIKKYKATIGFPSEDKALRDFIIKNLQQF
jgi:hypothetical protein